MEMEAINNTALSALFKGGPLPASMYGSAFNVPRKGRFDLVTGAATASEAAIIETLSRRFPDHARIAGSKGGPFTPGDADILATDGKTHRDMMPLLMK